MELLRWLIRHYKGIVGNDALVLDACGGTGTGSIAAMLEGHYCCYMDRDATQAVNALKRLQNFAKVERALAASLGALPDLPQDEDFNSVLEQAAAGVSVAELAPSAMVKSVLERCATADAVLEQTKAADGRTMKTLLPIYLEADPVVLYDFYNTQIVNVLISKVIALDANRLVALIKDKQAEGPSA